MVTTVTINPAVDKTYIVENFVPYGLNRAGRIIYNAGSKGINVSRILKQVGGETCVLGFVGGTNGDILLNELSTEGIEEDLVRVDANTRLNVKIMDLKTSRTTEVNETGTNVSDAELNMFMDKYKSHVKKSDLIVISGSIMPGMYPRVYYDLIKIAKDNNVPTYVDCSDNSLREALRAEPDCIKPNKAEFLSLIGKSSVSDEEIVYESRLLIEKYGVKKVVVTLGADGAIGVTKDEAIKITPPNVVVMSTVGAGDAFLAGLCHGHIKHIDFETTLILATSFSNAKVTKEGTKVPSLIELLAYTNGCKIERL